MRTLLRTIGFVSAATVILAGAGCAPQPKTTTPAPAANAPAANVAPTAAPSAAPKDVGVTKQELDKLKADAGALQSDDLKAIAQ